jgi:hypothetical protein
MPNQNTGQNQGGGQPQAQTQEQRDRIWEKNYDASLRATRDGNLPRALELALAVDEPEPLNRVAYAYLQRAYARQNPQEAVSDLEQAANAYARADNFAGQRNAVDGLINAGEIDKALAQSLSIETRSNRGAKALLNKIGAIAYRQKRYELAARAWIAAENEAYLQHVMGMSGEVFGNQTWGDFRVSYEAFLDNLYAAGEKGIDQFEKMLQGNR